MTALRSFDESGLAREMAALGVAAREAAAELGTATTEAKNAALTAIAKSIRSHREVIKSANASDVSEAKSRGISGAMLDRLVLDDKRIEAMAQGTEKIVELTDPVGVLIDEWNRPNGLRIQRIRVPLGVIGIIYESRPNVTADAGALCLKSGNAVILRGGSESFRSSSAILECLSQGLANAGLPRGCIQQVPTRDRGAVGILLAMTDDVDLIVPRGGRGLIERVLAESRIPVLGHLEGICHVYVDGAADLEMARDVVFNAKMRRPGICGAAETILVDSRIAKSHLPGILHPLFEAGCEVRGNSQVQAISNRVRPATDADWDTEYLDAIVAVRLVDGVDGAIAHITRHGTHHTDSIVTDDDATAQRFLDSVDSAIVLHNASTQFADGGEFGMGAEIGISTGKLHARGPVGLDQLTSYKYVVRGNGQIRP